MAANVSVILARDVPNLGHIGDLVAVRPGYARNFLVPEGLALPASPKRVTLFEHQKKVIAHKRRLLRADSEKRATEIAKIQVTITAKVGDQGKLFGSVTARDISRALQDAGHNIHHRDIKLGEPIRTIGLHTIDVRLEADVSSQVKVVVAPAAADPSSNETEEDEAPAAETEIVPADDEPAAV